VSWARRGLAQPVLIGPLRRPRCEPDQFVSAEGMSLKSPCRSLPDRLRRSSLHFPNPCVIEPFDQRRRVTASGASCRPRSSASANPSIPLRKLRRSTPARISVFTFRPSLCALFKDVLPRPTTRIYKGSRTALAHRRRSSPLIRTKRRIHRPPVVDLRRNATHC
jgi:hypothetical protein